MSDGGKGSAPRPFSVGRDTFEDNWDKIFGNKIPWDNYSDLPSPAAYDEVKKDDEPVWR